MIKLFINAVYYLFIIIAINSLEPKNLAKSRNINTRVRARAPKRERES